MIYSLNYQLFAQHTNRGQQPFFQTKLFCAVLLVFYPANREKALSSLFSKLEKRLKERRLQCWVLNSELTVLQLESEPVTSSIWLPLVASIVWCFTISKVSRLQYRSDISGTAHVMFMGLLGP